MSEATRKTKSNSDESTATQTPKASVATDIAAAIPAVEAKQVQIGRASCRERVSSPV